MTPRSLFNVILKVFGFFVIKDFLTIIPQLLSVIYYLVKPDALDQAIWTFITTTLILSIYGIISYYLIFKTETVINKFKLVEAFDDDLLPLNIHRSTILSISIIVIGGYIVADEMPNLCRQLFAYWQENRMNYSQTDPRLQYLVLSVAKVMIGFLLLSEQRLIVNLIERKRMGPPSE